uniref:Uncharacterized protein n=1 Tax=Glossina pallidipes TaxID=7398 RepID=A0A1A9ZJG5_GLOPL
MENSRNRKTRTTSMKTLWENHDIKLMRGQTSTCQDDQLALCKAQKTQNFIQFDMLVAAIKSLEILIEKRLYGVILNPLQAITELRFALAGRKISLKFNCTFGAAGHTIAAMASLLIIRDGKQNIVRILFHNIADSFLNAIAQSWEKLFGVPLFNT